MMYQIEFVEDGIRKATGIVSEDSKNIILEQLTAKGIVSNVLERPDRLWRCAKVVFDLQLIEQAEKAAKEKKDISGVYTFGDPKCLAKKGNVVKVKLRNGTIKNAYVVFTWRATWDEIQDIKKKLVIDHMGIIVEKI